MKPGNGLGGPGCPVRRPCGKIVDGMPDRRRFSERIGAKPVKSEIQTKSMDDQLRVSLWNVLTVHCWDRLKVTAIPGEFGTTRASIFFPLVWTNFLKWPVDTIPTDDYSALEVLRGRFFKFEWYEVYDFLEFTTQNYPCHDRQRMEFLRNLNLVLGRELSAYRIVGGVVTPITSAEEIASIEDALNLTDRFTPVRSHLERSLSLLSDRKSPDYRNSIKESISAVEALVQIVTGQSGATLGQGLKYLEQNGVILHTALKEAFSRLYGYTNDAEGIRHALLEEPTLTFEDAKFMLVCCSAFVNFVVSKLPA